MPAAVYIAAFHLLRSTSVLHIYYYGNHESTISWKEQSEGFYVMVSENQMIMDFDLDGRLERAE